MFHIDFKFCVQAHIQFCVHSQNQDDISQYLCPASALNFTREEQKKKFLIPNLFNQLIHQPESHFLIATSISSHRRHNHKGFKTHFETAIFLALNYRSNFLCYLLHFTRKAFLFEALNPVSKASSVHSTFHTEFAVLSLVHFLLYIFLESRCLFYPTSFPRTSVILTSVQLN